MSFTLPSSSSSAAASASTAAPTPTSSSSSSSPPIWIGLIGVSFLIFCLVSIIKWHGVSWREFRTPLNQNASTLWPQNENVRASGQPEMFDARMGECASDGLKWEKSMPFTVTILTDPESNHSSYAVRKGKVGKNQGNSAREREQGAESPRLQAAVLVAMPSPPRVGHAASGSFLRNELDIGLIEMPWVLEDHHSLKRNAS